MNFLPYPIDAARSQGPSTPLDQVMIVEGVDSASLEANINTFIDDLVALPDHTPIIVDIQYAAGVVPSVVPSALVWYRLLGEAPYPVL